MPRWLHTTLTGTFLLWAAVNTLVTAGRYDLNQGMYLWFCNLALWALAIGLWRRDRGLLLAFLGVAVLTQPLYVFDSLHRLVGRGGFIEMAEFMYQPGMGTLEFLLSRYHYFTLPAYLFVLYMLPRAGTNPLPYVLILNPLIFGLSYLFPADQNVNCIHESCLEEWIAWGGPGYSASFFAFVLAGNLLATLGLDALLRRFPLPPLPHRPSLIALGLCFLVGGVLTGADLYHKTHLPRLTCAAPFEDSGVRVACRFTLEEAPNIMQFHYSITNKLDAAQQCDTRADLYGEFEELHKGLYLRPHETLNLSVLLAYPIKDTVARVAATCQRFH